MSERITQAGANAKSADATRCADLQDRVRKARDRAKQNVDVLRHSTDALVREEASDHWQAVKNTWNDHVQHLHDKVPDKANTWVTWVKSHSDLIIRIILTIARAYLVISGATGLASS